MPENQNMPFPLEFPLQEDQIQSLLAAFEKQIRSSRIKDISYSRPSVRDLLAEVEHPGVVCFKPGPTTYISITLSHQY